MGEALEFVLGVALFFVTFRVIRAVRERGGASRRADRRAAARDRQVRAGEDQDKAGDVLPVGRADTLAWLESQPNQAGYVKSLIRADMERARAGEGATGE